MAEVRNEYLHKHNLPAAFDLLMRRLLESEPADPFRFLIGELVHVERSRVQSAVRDPPPTSPTEERAVGEAAGSRLNSADTWDFPSLKGRHGAMAKVLTPAMYAVLRHRRTPLGGSIDDAIQVGVDVREHTFTHGPGCVATDAGCFKTFRELFEPVVAKRHPRWAGSHPAEDLEVIDLVERAVFPEGSVLMSLVSVDRSCSGCAFPTIVGRGTRRLLHDAIVKAVASLPDEGEWLTPEEVERELAQCEDVGTGLLLPPLPLRSEYDHALRLRRDWPDNRGVWTAKAGGATVWSNIYEHLHCRVVSKGGDLYSPLKRLFGMLANLGETLKAIGLPFAHSAELGSMVSNLDNLGTSLTLIAQVHIPLLVCHQRFDQVLEKAGLTVVSEADLKEATYYGLRRGCGESAEHPTLSGAAAVADGGGVLWVKLVQKLGLTEAQAATAFMAGLHRLLELDGLLAKGQEIDIAIGLD